MRAISELIADPKVDPKEKAEKIVRWAINHVRGHGIGSTVYYSGGEEDELAVPVSLLDQIEKELLGVIRSD